MSLKRYGGVSCLSAVEEERLFHAGPAEGGLCLALYNPRLSRLVKTVWMWTLLDGQKESVWAVCPSVRASTMRTCVCFTCPLSSSHESDLTFSSTKRNVEWELPWFIDVATQMPSPQISCDTRSSELKILQGLGRVPVTDFTQNPSAELLQLKYIRLNFQKALGGMIACEWCQGGRAQIMSPTSPPSHGGRQNISSYPKSVLPGGALCGWGCSRGVCGAVVIWYTNISNGTLTEHKRFSTALSETGPMGPDSNWGSDFRITAPPACPCQAANWHDYIPL